MFALVLYDARGESAQRLLDRLEAFVQVLHADALGPRHALMHAGEAEAALLIGHAFRTLLHDLGVDQHAFEVFAVQVIVGQRCAVNHKQLDGAPDLRGGQPDAVSIVHRLKHVGDQLLQLRIAAVDGLRFFS